MRTPKWRGFDLLADDYITKPSAHQGYRQTLTCRQLSACCFPPTGSCDDSMSGLSHNWVSRFIDNSKAIARCLLPDILTFFESEESQREFAEWKKQREAEKQEAKAE